MELKRDYDQVWKDLASLIKSLPLEEQRRYQINIGMFTHDLRQVVGIIYSAESLLRRTKGLPAEELELLEMIRNASKRAIGLITDFAQPFDGLITLPLGNSPEDPKS
jgi:signal transduction histidine kinase